MIEEKKNTKKTTKKQESVEEKKPVKTIKKVKNPTKENSFVLIPEAIKAFMAAHAPGIVITSFPSLYITL